MKETNQIVKKSNDLITAKYRLTIIQQYVLHNVISQIHIEDTDFKKYEVNVRSIAENHGIDNKNARFHLNRWARVSSTARLTASASLHCAFERARSTSWRAFSVDCIPRSRRLSSMSLLMLRPWRAAGGGR